MTKPTVLRKLFFDLYSAKNESDVDKVIESYPDIFSSTNWYPLGGSEGNYGVVENQQSNPVAAIVEKLTNSIDAILMRKCYEAGIDPRSKDAPRSIEEAMDRFFPAHKNWDLSNPRKEQALSIQVIADSYPKDTSDTSLIIYDDGEGQNPNTFEDTFLGLIAGNKNEIHFVQGKYHMGGSGAITFCGKRRYQLIASKRFDGKSDLGFTLVRKHPLTIAEAKVKKSTWYEYFKIDEGIASFPAEQLDLGLYQRKFTTGTIIKLYSYELRGNIPIRRELGRSLNEFLYEPALPIYLIETAERYPKERNLRDDIYGLKRVLTEKNDYIQEVFSETYTDKQIGTMRVTVHVFKTMAKGKRPRETRDTIQVEYFKNNMAVLFSMNGQVHAHYTTEFITRSLKFNLLKDYLLIHVDCTDMNPNFRSELFMASRDRLKHGEESSILRGILRDNLKKGRLKDIYKKRKDNISVESEDDNSMLRSFADSLPITDELRGLISQTFKLDQEDKTKKRNSPSKPSRQQENTEPFNPQRFPSFFKLNATQKGDKRVIKIPLNGEKTVVFDSDIENEYLDRVEEPGELNIAVLDYAPNDKTGGNKKGTANEISDFFAVNRRSPQEGKIKVILKPDKEVKVGDEIQVRVDLTAPGSSFTEIFWVQISDPNPTMKKAPNRGEEKIGLPNHVLVYSDDPNEEGRTTWEKLNESGIEMDWDMVVYPHLGDGVLQTIYINMDSNVLKSYKSKIPGLSLAQNQVANNRYISAVYFHTLFLYVINKKQRYLIYKENGENNEVVDLEDYLKELFSSYYAEFLMNFGTDKLMEALN